MNDQVLRTQTDRRQLQQIIAGLTEGVILIEPDQRILWANEAALAMHGVDSLEGLGADTGEYRERFRLRYRNNHPLQEGQYPAERLVAGECFSDVVVEVFPAADEDTRWVHRVRGLVLTTPEDKPDCLVLILHDATEWASAEQRFEKTFNANPAPAVICRLSDYRYVKVNVGFLEMTGYARDQVIGRSVYELDVLDQAERRELAVERLGAGETIPQMEASLRVAEGGRKCVVVAGQPIEVGEEACMLFTFTDLEPRKKAEEALRKSEERFAKAFRMAPVPSLVLCGDDLQVLDINQAFSETFGYQAEELLGESTVACGLWQDGGAERLGELLAQSGSVRNVQLRLQHKDRNGLDCLVSAEAVSLNEQDCVLVALLDISDRRRTEMELVHAIETVMQDASWFSRTLIEKLANAVPRQRAGHRRRTGRPDCARARGVRPYLPGPGGQGDRQGTGPGAEHRAQPRGDHLRQARCPQPWRGHRLGTRTRIRAGAAQRQRAQINEEGTNAPGRLVHSYLSPAPVGADTGAARPACPRPWSCTFLRGASRAVRTSVPLASFALAGASTSFRIFAPLPLLVRDGILPAVCECSGLVS